MFFGRINISNVLVVSIDSKFIEPATNWFSDMSVKVRKKYSPRCCGYPSKNPEYFELSWDLVDCILGCDFCSSPVRPKISKDPVVEFNPTQIFRETTKNIKKPSRSFIRFSGGEPTLYWKELLQVFESLANDETMVNVPILIQTNGISIGMGTVNLFELNRHPFNKLKFLFELSIKGTNSEEFELLTRTSKKLYAHQLTAYRLLKNVQGHNSNLSFIPVLGTYHSSIKGKRSKFVFVYPSDQTLMFDGYRPWDKEFEKIWNEAERKWVEPLRMSPKAMWENVLKRCGPDGAGILKYFPKGVPTNLKTFFSAKPRGYEYAHGIVNNQYW